MHDEQPEQTTILVVEDETFIRMIGAENLADAGFHVLEAANADEAVNILEHASDVQLVFTDVDMPGSMNGRELAEVIHKRWPDIRLLVTSGKDIIKDEELPDDGRFVPKPYRVERVVREIRELIGMPEPSH